MVQTASPGGTLSGRGNYFAPAWVVRTTGLSCCNMSEFTGAVWLVQRYASHDTPWQGDTIESMVCYIDAYREGTGSNVTAQSIRLLLIEDFQL